VSVAAGMTPAALRRQVRQAMRAAAPTVAEPVRYDEDRPRLAGVGPAAFSTSTTVAEFPRYYADVNGYYLALGVRHDAGARELREAFAARDGHRSRWLTYVLAQLRDREVRVGYDRMLPWQRYPDRYERERARRLSKLALARMRREAGGDADRLAALVRQREDEGFEFSSLDDPPADAAREMDKAAVDELIRYGLYFPYGHYLWRSRGADDVVLLRWQRYLVAAASAAGLVVHIAVGSFGRQPHPYVVARVGRLDVVFLHEDEPPTREHAAAAVRALAEAHRTHHDTTQIPAPATHRALTAR
jgi:hypothetical protein